MSSSISCLIGLGSNLGDRESILRAVADDLRNSDRIRNFDMSSLWETNPIGGPEGQSPFLNAAARIETDLAPENLLDVLKFMEKKYSRIPSGHWGPRTLDLDILIYGDRIIRSDRLIIPHPRFYWRSFALIPAEEVAPDMILPTTGLTVHDTLHLLRFNTQLALRKIILDQKNELGNSAVLKPF